MRDLRPKSRTTTSANPWEDGAKGEVEESGVRGEDGKTQ